MNSRILWFWLVALLVYFCWMNYMQWKFPAAPGGKKAASAEKKPAPEAGKAEPADAKSGKTDASVTKTDDKKPAENIPAKPPAPDEHQVPLRDNLTLGQNIQEGGAEKTTAFVKLSNQGAVVKSLQLNTYKNEKQTGPFILLQEDPKGTDPYELDLAGDSDHTLKNKTWQVVETNPDSIVFRTTALGGKLQVDKRFSLGAKDGYIQELEITLRNLSDEPLADLRYTLTGGIGVPNEGEWYSSTYRSIVAWIYSLKSGYPTRYEQAAYELIKQIDKNREPVGYTDGAIQFAGVTSLYFASLILEPNDPRDKRQLDSAQPFVVNRHGSRPELSNIGIRYTSLPISIDKKQEVTHKYLLFNGPRSEEVLAAAAQYSLPELIYYPSYLGIPIGQIAHLMVAILNFFYMLVRDYGLAIILMTVAVRMCMFPLSFKQTKSMQKLQLLQPKMQEIKEKYGKDKEKYQRALMDLYAEHKVNPIGGCLPLLLQLPIFVGLYQALSMSFSLRHSEFLYGWTWIKDLSAPDQLFPFGFNMPLLGPYFNLLPIISVALMLVQMIISSPPATTPEAEVQRKTMMFMMVFMGFLFYKIPSGLCVYIITSGLWSMLERKFLPKPKKAEAAGAEQAVAPAKTEAATTNGPTWITPAKSKKKGKSRR